MIGGWNRLIADLEVPVGDLLVRTDLLSVALAQLWDFCAQEHVRWMGRAPCLRLSCDCVVEDRWRETMPREAETEADACRNDLRRWHGSRIQACARYWSFRRIRSERQARTRSPYRRGWDARADAGVGSSSSSIVHEPDRDSGPPGHPCEGNSCSPRNLLRRDADKPNWGCGMAQNANQA